MAGFYDPDKSHQRHDRNLPHWEQDGTWVFVTFRLADSIPRDRLEQWLRHRNIWLAQHSIDVQCSCDEVLQQLPEAKRRMFLQEFGKRFHDFLDDCHGACLLRHSAHAQIVRDALHHFDGDRYELGAYVIMPNHVHALLSPAAAHSVSSIMKSWKGFTAREINRATGRTGQLWQHESFDHLVRHAGSLAAIEKYIRENPTKARLRDGEYILRVA